MFIVLPRFAANRAVAGEYMEDHNAWVQRGFDDAVFLAVGSLQPGPGGTVLAHNTTLAELEARVAQDPFVEHGVVEAEVQQVELARTDQRLSFLRG